MLFKVLFGIDGTPLYFVLCTCLLEIYIYQSIEFFSLLLLLSFLHDGRPIESGMGKKGVNWYCCINNKNSNSKKTIRKAKVFLFFI